MAVPCDLILKWDATPAQLAALGGALWRWCSRTAGDAGIYQYLDNQALADLIAGRLPVARQTPRPADRRGVHLKVRDEASQDRQATIDSLRREVPTDAVEDVVVEGASWDHSASPNGPLP
jgi:hypothetical protein